MSIDALLGIKSPKTTLIVPRDLIQEDIDFALNYSRLPDDCKVRAREYMELLKLKVVTEGGYQSAEGRSDEKGQASGRRGPTRKVSESV